MMRFLLRLLVCLALSTLIYDCAFAFGKITVDPNTGGSPAPKAPADARVAQKVTYEARYMPVQQIIEDLTAMTGIRLYAGANKNDWPVRNRKMNIFVKDVRMADLMNSIAHAMKFKWSRNDDVNPPTYRLVVDGKAAAAADAQMARAKSEYERGRQEMRQEWIDLVMKYGTKPLSEMESFRDTDPTLYEQSRRGITQGLYELFTEVPETKSRFATGQSFRISSDKLSEKTNSLLFDAANELKKYLQISRGEELIGLRDILKPEYTFDIVFGRLETESIAPNLRWEFAAAGSTGYFRIEKDLQDFEIADLPNRNHEWERYRSIGHYKILDGIAPKEAWAMTGNPEAKLKDDLKKEEEFLYPSEPLIEHPALDELEKTIKLNIVIPKTDEPIPEMAINSYIASLQKALADATGLGIVSDSWVSIKGERLPDQEAKLSELLDKFSTQFNYNWDKSSSILEFRHRKWWKNRLNQISDDLVASWSENTSKNGFLGLDDLAQISTLNYDQAEESLAPDKVLGSAGIGMQIIGILDTTGNLQWLRLYSTLNSQQRTYLADRWISGAMLTPDQWKLAQAMFDRIGSLRSDALFSLKNVPDDNALRYEFREFEVTNQDGDNPAANEDRKWRVTLPKYTPPASPKKAAN